MSMYNLTYRPKNIDELDNTTARDQLQKILASKDIPQALLFTGPKGTGKTSAARIFAKTLNGKENEKAIAEGTSPDVIEMDAASHRKIDDIRDLIAELKFSPLVSKYKIYIIDEVHMLTKEAFNALLKSLEEPPKSTIFILATTEAHSLPETIRSRCTIVNFNEAQKADVLSMLNRIVKGEKLKIDEKVLDYIADHSDGSFRDAAKILHLAVINEAKTVEDVKKLLGQAWYKGDVLELIAEDKLKETLEWIKASDQNGANFQQLITELLQDLHKQLLAKSGIEVNDFTEYNLTTKRTAHLISLLQKAYNEMRNSPIQSLPLEIAVVEFLADNED